MLPGLENSSLLSLGDDRKFSMHRVLIRNLRKCARSQGKGWQEQEEGMSKQRRKPASTTNREDGSPDGRWNLAACQNHIMLD